MSVYMTEAEQLQVITKWWQRYSTPILIVLIVGMSVLAFYKYWTWHNTKMLTQASNAYEQLMVVFSEHNNQEIKIRALQLLRDYKTTIYADVAKLTLAKIYVDEEDFDKALTLLNSIVHNEKASAFKQIARIRSARILITKRLFNEALQELSMINGNSYISIVHELKGDILVATGQYPQAIKLYQKAISETKVNGLGNLFLEMKTNDIIALMHPHSVPALRTNLR